jgi:hypothetical protein
MGHMRGRSWDRAARTCRGKSVINDRLIAAVIRVRDRRLCRPRDCADVVLGVLGGTGFQVGEVGTIWEAVRAPARVRHEVDSGLTGSPGKRHMTGPGPKRMYVSAFTRVPRREDRGSRTEYCARDLALPHGCVAPLGQDCADVADTNLLVRSGCRNKVGTIPRSAQSAFSGAIQKCPRRRFSAGIGLL